MAFSSGKWWPKTILEASREFAVAPLAAMSPERRRLLERTCPDVVDLAIDTADGLQPDAATVADATAISGGLLAERAPLATPLYPLHDVATYLKTRAPRDLLAGPPLGSRLPRTGT